MVFLVFLCITVLSEGLLSSKIPYVRRGALMENSQATKNDKIFEIINNVLQHVFGEETTQLIYGHLERRYSLRQHDISDNINIFTKCLEDFLYDAALPIENRILHEILAATGLASGVSCQIAVPEDIESDIPFVASR